MLGVARATYPRTILGRWVVVAVLLGLRLAGRVLRFAQGLARVDRFCFVGFWLVAHRSSGSLPDRYPRPAMDHSFG